MSFPLFLDQDRGTFRADSKSKSTINIPSFKEKDLNGCGTAEYFAFSHSFALNYRSGCAKPVPAMTMSVKTLRLASSIAVPMSSYYVDAVEAIAGWAFALSGSTIPLDTSGINISASNNTPFVSTIKEEISDGTPEGFSKIIVSKPTTNILYDVCQPTLAIGRTSSVSITEQVFDTATCRTKLGQTISISMSVYKTAVYSSTSSAPIPWGVTSVAQVSDILADQVEQAGLINVTYLNNAFSTQAALILAYATNPAENTTVNIGF